MEERLYNLFGSLRGELPLFEQEGGVTYYDLRQFVTILYKNVKEKQTKVVLGDILRTLAVMEIKRLTVPTIKKLKSSSPAVFGG